MNSNVTSGFLIAIYFAATICAAAALHPTQAHDIGAVLHIFGR